MTIRFEYQDDRGNWRDMRVYNVLSFEGTYDTIALKIVLKDRGKQVHMYGPIRNLSVE